MAAPTLQFKRGLLANLPGLRGGEPGFTTDSYDLYVGIDSTTANNQFVGSGRYWSVNSATKGGGVNLVEGTDNGTDFITLKSPDTLSGIVTFVMPGTDGSANDVLITDGAGNLSFSSPAASQFTLAADSGSNDTFNTGETLTFAGTANEIDTTVSNNQIQIGLPSDVTVGGGLTATTFTLAGVAVTAILDEDTLASDRADALATQQSIKAYIDNNVTAQDLDVAGDSGTGAVDLDSQSLTIAGTSNEIETSASNQTVTIGLPAAVQITTSLDVPTVEATNLKAKDGTSAITIADSTGKVTMSGNLQVTGNLIVDGSTTQVNSTITTIEDQLLDLGMADGSVPSADLNKDVGVLFNYYTNAPKKAAVYWDDSTSRVVVAAHVTESSGVLTQDTGGALEVASLYVSGCAGSTVEVIGCSSGEVVITNATIDGGSF